MSTKSFGVDLKIDKESIFISKKTIWSSCNDNFSLNLIESKLNIKYYIKKFENQLYHFSEITNRSSPYLYYIFKSLLNAGLPSEFMILPIIESGYKVNAKSITGALGIWQIGSLTGLRYSLSQSYFYDKRKSIVNSTKIALNYIKFLCRHFNKNWLFVIAAYNAGEGRVYRAMNNNSKIVKGIVFWHLPLPKQTKNYIAKLFAIIHLFKYNSEFIAKLSHVENKPYFKNINIGMCIDLNTISNLSNIKINELTLLNPGYVNLKTSYNFKDYSVLIPINYEYLFKLNLDKAIRFNASMLTYSLVKENIGFTYMSKRSAFLVPTFFSFNKTNNKFIGISQDVILPINR